MRKVLILVENSYEELELWVPYYRFLEAELDVVLVGPEAGCTYTGKHDLPARADGVVRRGETERCPSGSLRHHLA